MKTKKSERTRQRILAAASNIIDERGSADFQMMEVAKRCNMSKGALYYYFADRDEIVEEILSERLDKFVDSLEAGIKQSNTPEGALETLCVAFARSIDGQDTVIATIAMELVRGGLDTFSRVQDRFTRMNNLIATQIEIAKEEGNIRENVDPEFISSCISGTFFFAAFFKRTNDANDEIDSNKLVHELMEFITHGILFY